MIAVENLTFAYEQQTPLFEGFSWSVDAREAWSVVGPSGCGKSTLLYLLTGLRFPTEGVVKVAGQQVVRPRPKTGLILQDYGLLPWATVGQNAGLGLRVRRLYGPDGRHAPIDDRVRSEQVEQRVSFWLDRMGIAHLCDKYPAQISGGQRQRTAIARTLAMNPDLLLMDEPFSSLDTLTREDLEKLTLELREEAGLTAVVVTHNIEEAVYMGQRLLVLCLPPHRTPLVVENPSAGVPGYRGSQQFLAMCNQVRRLLANKCEPSSGDPYAQA
jgi:NitT/TauT family transport system ATP-binding protein